MRTITAEGTVVEGSVERDEPLDLDGDEDVALEKAESKKSKKQVELAAKDARPKPQPKKKGTAFPMPKTATAQAKKLAASEPERALKPRKVIPQKSVDNNPARAAAKQAKAPAKKGGK